MIRMVCSDLDGTLLRYDQKVLGERILSQIRALAAAACVCLVAAGALVTEGTIVPPGSVVMGVPGKIRGAVTPEQQAETRANTAGYVDCARAHAAEPVLK